jgi:hypothetical protein
MRSADFIEPGDLRTDRPCYVLPPRTPMRSTFITIHDPDLGDPIFLALAHITCIMKSSNPSHTLVIGRGIRVYARETMDEIQALIDAAAAGSD